MEALTLAAAAAPVAAPASAAWAQLDLGIGVPSIVLLCIFIGAGAAVLRDKVKHKTTLAGAFFTSIIATIAAMVFVVAPGLEKSGLLQSLNVAPTAAQAVAGLFMSYHSQRWAPKFTDMAFRRGVEQTKRRTTDEQ